MEGEIGGGERQGREGGKEEREVEEGERSEWNDKREESCSTSDDLKSFLYSWFLV